MEITTKRNLPQRVLGLPDLEHAKTAVLNSLNSADAKPGYRHAIDEFVDWYCSEPRLAFNRIVVLRYRSHLESRQLAPGTINLRLGTVRRLAYEAADCGLLSADLAAGSRRVSVKKLGMRLGNWLTRPIVKLANNWQIALLSHIPRKGESEHSRVFTGDFDGGPGWTNPREER